MRVGVVEVITVTLRHACTSMLRRDNATLHDVEGNRYTAHTDCNRMAGAAEGRSSTPLRISDRLIEAVEKAVKSKNSLYSTPREFIEDAIREKLRREGPQPPV